MKRIKISLAALAFVFAIGAAVTPKVVTALAPPPPEEQLYWFESDNATYTGNHQTKTMELPASGCPDRGNVVCENGYRQSQLADPNDPDQGLSNTAGSAIQQIVKPQ